MLSSGPLDPTFGSGGVVTTPVGSNSNTTAYAAALQGDGKILAAGYAYYPSGARFALTRYTASGSPDPSFGSGGTVTTKVGNGTSYGAHAVAVQTDGKIVLAGGANFRQGTEFALSRYNPNGSLDTSFGSKGIVSTALGSQDVAFAAVIQPADGKILAAGFSKQAGGQYDFALARYNPNGSLDTSFGSGGKVLTAFSGNLDTAIQGMTLQSDGTIVVAGYVGPGPGSYGERFTVARYNANGALDTSFGPGGTGFVILPPSGGGHTENAQSVVVQPDGKIVAVGWVHLSGYDEWVIARLKADGSTDSTFGSAGTVTTLIGGGGDAYAVTLQSDAKIVVAGGPNFAVARFNSDGSLDTTFCGTGTVTTQIGSGGAVRAVAIQPADARIVVAGGAVSGSSGTFAVARYLSADPQIGSFTASPNPVPAGGSVTLTVAGIVDTNPGSSITQVAFYQDSNGDGRLEVGTDTLLGYGTQSAGTWTLTFSTAGLAPGAYTLFAQAEDNYGLFSDPFALTLAVQ